MPLEDCDRGQVESALAAPGAGYGAFEKYPSLEAKAAAMLYAFAKIQPCIEGNKRLTAIIVSTFLRLNGGRLTTKPGELAAVILDVANRDTRDRDQVTARLIAWLRTRIAPTDGAEAT